MSSQNAGPIFVVGSPRTGTTLTREILNLHPDIHLYDEVHYNERVVDLLGDKSPLEPSMVDRAVDILLQHGEWAFGAGQEARNAIRDRLGLEPVTHAALFSAFLNCEAAAHGKTIWGDSSPQDILYMEVLKAWYPDARFIGVVRDPRAFLASYKNYYKKGIKSYRNRFNPLTNSVLWRSYMNALLAARRSSLAADLTLLKYEDLVADPEGEVRRICDFLGLEFQPEMLEVQRRNSSYISVQEDRKQSGVSSGSVDRWREVLNRAELWILERTCSTTMRQFGYEPEGVRLGLRDLPDLIVPACQLPGRLFNALFRSRKPFTMHKLRRVLGLVKTRESE